MSANCIGQNLKPSIEPSDSVSSHKDPVIDLDDEDKIFTKSENEAAFPGGIAAWTFYLKKNLNEHIAKENGAPVGTYNATVKFIVSKDGSVSDIVAQTYLGYGMEREVIRIIKKGPKWFPALQNGRAVKAYKIQSVTFSVTTESSQRQ